MREIPSKEALLHLAIAQQNKGKNIDFDKLCEEYFEKEMEELKVLSKLDAYPQRFEQCFEDCSAKYYLEDVPVEKLYSKYYKPEWGEGRIIELARYHLINIKGEDVYNLIFENIEGDKINPRVIVIKQENEDKYNVLDGMHRVSKFIQLGKEKVPCVVIVVKNDFV